MSSGSGVLEELQEAVHPPTSAGAGPSTSNLAEYIRGYSSSTDSVCNPTPTSNVGNSESRRILSMDGFSNALGDDSSESPTLKYNPEVVFDEGPKLVKAMEESLKPLLIESKVRKGVWRQDLDHLQRRILPKTLIAICGATGAGKSSLLNAILKDNIIPTSGVEACTSVVTEISYHSGPRIIGNVSFLSSDDWSDELSLALKDLEGVKRSDLHGREGPAEIAWHKIHAVYPTIEFERLVGVNRMDVQTILDHDPAVSQLLGTTKEISSKNSAGFRKKIGKYIDSDDRKDTSGRGQPPGRRKKLWPLIRQVSIQCNAEALSTGAILVDLPGAADTNAARSNIAKGYMKKASNVWIVAPIERAIVNKTARDLLDTAFKTQLLMDGNYDDHFITFIASKCDVISFEETCRELHLYNDPELQEINSDRARIQEDLSRARRQKDEISNLINKALYPERHFTSPSTSENKKRKNRRVRKKVAPKKIKREDPESIYDGNDSSSELTSLTESNAEDGADDFQSNQTAGTVSRIERSIETLRREHADLIEEESRLEKQLATAQKRRNTFCSMRRSEHARKRLKEDFRAGIRELDEAAAEERDPENWDPAESIRDYDTINLPVFACSSSEYAKLTKQVKGDGEPSCFSNVDDTGIPALQGWCHRLTAKFQQRAAREFITDLTSFVETVQSYIERVGIVTLDDRANLREIWETKGLINSVKSHGSVSTESDTNSHSSDIAMALVHELCASADNCVNGLQSHFRKGLETKCQLGAAKASALAVSKVNEFARKARYFQTYRATLCRHGKWSAIDVNDALIDPFRKTIAFSWSSLFNQVSFKGLEDEITEKIRRFLQEFELAAAPRLRPRIRTQGELCIKEAKQTLVASMTAISSLLGKEQRAISRGMTSRMQERLSTGYDDALAEIGGKGSFGRSKDTFRAYVDLHHDEMFRGEAADIVASVETLVNSLRSSFVQSIRTLVEKIEVNLSVLWEEIDDDPRQMRARKDALDTVNMVQLQVAKWSEAARLLEKGKAREAPHAIII